MFQCFFPEVQPRLTHTTVTPDVNPPALAGTKIRVPRVVTRPRGRPPRSADGWCGWGLVGTTNNIEDKVCDSKVPWVNHWVNYAAALLGKRMPSTTSRKYGS